MNTAADIDAEQVRRLRNTKRVPLALLVLMALLFAWTLHHPAPWAGWVGAFAEAGMVGALADWFAVVALFRHPMGIPIPHTAIVPRRKDEIGDSLANFVAEHFLHPDVVRAKLESMNPSAQAAAWAQSPAGTLQLVQTMANVLSWLSGAWQEQNVRQFLRRISRRQIERVDFAPMLGAALDWLVQDGRHQRVLTQALQYAVVLLHDHRDIIRGNVQQESPWWLPGFIDDRIVKQMLDRIETLLLQMSLDENHEMRQEFERTIRQWALALRESPELRRQAERIREAALANEDLQDYLYRLWMDLVGRIDTDLQQPDSAIREQLEKLVLGLANNLSADADMQRIVNRWVVDSSVAVVRDHRKSMASLISDTVRGWDAADTSRRVELAIGTDLQFIRINGTLVGGLVGLLIHAVSHATL